MSTWASFTPSEYITADDFDGKDVTLTITGLDKHDFEKDDGTHEKRGVVAFKETDKHWVLNVTNIQLLRAIWPTPEDAVGHKVTLTSEKVRFGAETVLGIRVKGSPELSAPIAAIVKLPRRKAITRELLPTGKKPSPPVAEPDEAPWPGEDPS